MPDAQSWRSTRATLNPRAAASSGDAGAGEAAADHDRVELHCGQRRDCSCSIDHAARS
jgi:hypothetical protein